MAALIAAAATGERPKAPQGPTPLTDFSSPFVFGRFQVPPDNPLTKDAVEAIQARFQEKEAA